MKTSANGRAFIGHFEGLRLTAYLCPANVPTIGYGHTKGVTKSDVGVRKITEAEADDLLGQDLTEFESQINKMVKVSLNQDQFDALCSFTFNLGAGALQSSTLLKQINAGNFDDVPTQLLRWVRGGGVVLPGLVTRRTAEGKLWNGEDWR